MDTNLAVPHKELEPHVELAGRQAKQSHDRLKVNLCHVATPDADARVSRALDILLEAAAKNDTSKRGTKSTALDNLLGY